MKKKMSIILTMLLVMFTPCFVQAAQKAEPVYTDGESPAFYANGTPIVIKENPGKDGAIITYDEKSVEVSEKTTVYGGGTAGTSYDTSSITMNSGTVASIMGGGQGTPSEEAIVKDATIKMTGGTIQPYTYNGKKTKGTIFGGGLLYSTVENVDIQITGGTIYAVVGGGSSYSSYNGVGVDVGTKASPETSKNRTGKVKIVISGGVIHSSLFGYGLVYGGGQGYSYVDETTTTISGDPDLSKAWVVAGGSNGRTDDATLNIKGGKINTVQTINRGSMINARVNMTAGSVGTMFVGGEDPETFNEDIVNGGFLGNIVLDITGGTVTTLALGSNYNSPIAKDATYASVFYDSSVVKNSSSLNSTMGTIAKPYSQKGVVEEAVTEDKTIAADFFEALKETNNDYSLSVNDEYEWTFSGKDIVDPTISVNTKITLTTDAPETIKSGITEEVNDLKLTDVIFLNFEHHGKLPGKAIITYDVSQYYSDGATLYVLHYNEVTGKLENQQKVVVQDGKIIISVEECSSYVVSKTAAGQATTNDQTQAGNNTTNQTGATNTDIVESPQTNDISITLLIATIIACLGGLIVAFKKSYKLLK